MSKPFTFRAFIWQLGCYPEVANAIAEAAKSMEEINIDARTSEPGILHSKMDDIPDNIVAIRQHTKKLLELMRLEDHWQLEDGPVVEGGWGLSQDVFDYLGGE